MHVCSWLLDFGCVIVVAGVFVVLLFPDLTTTETRVKVLRLKNVFKLGLLSVQRWWFCCC